MLIFICNCFKSEAESVLSMTTCHGNTSMWHAAHLVATESSKLQSQDLHTMYQVFPTIFGIFQGKTFKSLYLHFYLDRNVVLGPLEAV